MSKGTYHREWLRENTRTLSVYVPRELLEEFRELVAKNGDVQRQLIIEFIENYVKENR